jgi:ACS family D-galactonate transporter-like MFS transporter
MLTAYMAINAADKAVFGLAAAPIMAEFGLSYGRFGAIGSSFFALFSISALLVGVLGDRIAPRLLLAVTALLWSVAQIPVGFAPVLPVLIGLRVLLGAGEGPALPMALKAGFAHFAVPYRARVSGCIFAGTPIGTALAAVGCTWIIVHAGWQAAFVVLGIASAVWALGWAVMSRGEPAPAEAIAAPPVPLLVLLRVPSLIGVVAGVFALYLLNAVSVIWFPNYLHVAVGLSETAAGTFLALAWPLQIVVFVAGAIAIDRIRARARDAGQVLRFVAFAGIIVSAVAALGLSATVPSDIALPLVLLTLVAPVVTYTVAGPIVAEIVPERHRGAGFGALVAIYSVGGLIGPVAFGAIVGRSPSAVTGFGHAFLALGSVLLATAALAVWLIRPAIDARRFVAFGATPGDLAADVA